MYTVKVLSLYTDKEYFVAFQSYSSAINLISVANSTKETKYSIEDYLEASQSITNTQPENTTLIDNDPTVLLQILEAIQ
jgi:hypothetical protein